MRIAAFPKGELDAMVARRTKTVFEWILQARAALPVDGLELHTGFFWSTADDFIARVGEALTTAGFEMTRAGYDGWISIEDGVGGMDELRQSAGFLLGARDTWFGGSTAVHVARQEAAR